MPMLTCRLNSPTVSHLHPHALRLPLLGRGDGLGDAQGAGLAGVEHHREAIPRSDVGEADRGGGVLPRGAGGGGCPEIFNTDQGSPFTSPRFTSVLREAGVCVSMNGRGRWMDNVFIERLWRSLKYECVFLHASETGSELRAGLSRWVGYYNAQQPHSALGGRTPDEAYAAIGTEMERLAA